MPLMRVQSVNTSAYQGRLIFSPSVALPLHTSSSIKLGSYFSVLNLAAKGESDLAFAASKHSSLHLELVCHNLCVQKHILHMALYLVQRQLRAADTQ